MAGEIITTQELEDAKVDAKDLGEAVNEDKVITPRYGDSYMSAPMVSRTLIEMSVPNANYYLTKTALDADLANVIEGQYAMVVNDLDFESVPTADNGLYCKISGVWEFLAWNPLTQFLAKISESLSEAKSYTAQSIFNTRKEIRFAPASHFTDADFNVIDLDGNLLSDYQRLYSNLSRSITAPYLSFDEKAYAIIDRDYNLIDSQSYSLSSTPIWIEELYVEYIHETKTLKASWVHDSSLMLRATWCPNGHNELFNFKEMAKAPLGDPSSAEWQIIQSETSDFLPPITFIATDGVTSDSGTTTVGGNHGTSGGSGLLTAHMTEFKLFINNVLIGNDFTGYVDSVQTQHTNMLYAGNTVNEQRYCMQQDFHLNFSAGNIEVIAQDTALHNIKIYRNGGTQLIGGVWDESVHFYDGVQQAPVTGTPTTVIQAGTKTTAPNCWATVLKSNELGFAVAWVDRDYGSKLDHIGATDYIAFKNNTSWKFYNFVVRVDVEGGRDYPAGTQFKWRGGYSYAPINIVDGIDSAFIFKKGRQNHIGYSLLASTSGLINLPENLIGNEAEGLSSEINGFSSSTTAYIATSAKLG